MPNYSINSKELLQKKLAEGLKWCYGHMDFLPVADFSPRQSRCRVCRNLRILQLGQQTSPEKKTESAKKPRCKEQRRRYYQQNKEHVRNKQLINDYGKSREWYNAKLIEQGGHCALCPQTPEQEGKELAVDHDHLTGELRGLLCGLCNRALERIESIPNWCDSSKKYLCQYSGRVL